METLKEGTMQTVSDSEEIISIGDLAKELGLTTRTLRYWEDVGIIESVERTEGANRGYTTYFVRRIRFILKLKELGLTIKEMQDLYFAYGEAKQTDQMVPRLLVILENHIGKVDEKITKLASLRVDIVEYRQKMAKKLNRVNHNG